MELFPIVPRYVNHKLNAKKLDNCFENLQLLRYIQFSLRSQIIVKIVALTSQTLYHAKYQNMFSHHSLPNTYVGRPKTGDHSKFERVKDLEIK